MSGKFIKNTFTVLAGLHAANSIINSVVNNLEKSRPSYGSFYPWKHGKIYYEVEGNGSPILLIHNLDHRYSSYEWEEVTNLLSQNHKVYKLDLPGCGRSEKPKSTYSAYMYIQAIKNFTENVIKDKPIVIASGDSSSFIITLNAYAETLFNKVILINPAKITNGNTNSDILKMSYLKLLNLPIIGTSIYNAENLYGLMFLNKAVQKNMDEGKIRKYKNAYIDTHLGKSNGRFLRASKINNYLEINTTKTGKLSHDTTALFSINNEKSTLAKITFEINTNNIDIKEIPSKSYFPHRDNPELFYKTIKELLLKKR